MRLTRGALCRWFCLFCLGFCPYIALAFCQITTRSTCSGIVSVARVPHLLRAGGHDRFIFYFAFFFFRFLDIFPVFCSFCFIYSIECVCRACRIQYNEHACVFLTLNRSFYPSTYGTTGVRADYSILCPVSVPRSMCKWSQKLRYIDTAVLHRYAVSRVDNATTYTSYENETAKGS